MYLIIKHLSSLKGKIKWQEVQVEINMQFKTMEPLQYSWNIVFSIEGKVLRSIF